MHTPEEKQQPWPALQNGIDSGSRKSSITTQLTSQTRDSVAEEKPSLPLGQTDNGVQPLTELEPSEYEKAVEHGIQLLSDPDAVQQWLTSFGHLKDGTNVSLRFRNIAPASTQAAPHSLTPLFLHLVPAWYREAVHRRRVDKLARDSSYKEQDDLNWLLKYIADYILLDHEYFDEDELAQLCECIALVCQETGRQSVINDSIVIFHNIMTATTFPQKALSLILEVHCAGAVTLPNPPSQLPENVGLLLNGSHHDYVMQWLLECITTPTVQNNSQRLIEARGAIRHIRNNLNTVNKSGSHAIDLDLLLDALNQASKCCVFRFCTEVLSTCQSILESDQLSRLLALELRNFLGTIDNCTRTILPRNGSSRSFDALRSPDRAQVAESQRQNDRHLAERRNVMKQLLNAFEQVWPKLSHYQARLVCDLFMENTKDLSDTQAGAVVSYLSKEGLLLPGANDWSQRGTKVFDSFVRNARLSPSKRVDAAIICIDAAAAAVNYTATDSSGSQDSILITGKNIVDRLLNMIGKEYSTAVVEGILGPLKRLTNSVDQDNKPQYAHLIISKLLRFVKTERDAEDEVFDEHVVLFTQAIRDIFLRGLHSSGVVTVQAFEALLEIASAKCRSRRCRLAALRLLLRIRCDSAGMVFVQTAFESEYIAAALCRTEATSEAHAKEQANYQRASAGHIVHTIHGSIPRQLWTYPKEASCLQDWDTETSKLVTIVGAQEPGHSIAELSMTNWLVTVIESLQADNDWETYSFILVHLGAQLFNIKLFKTSLQAIVMLRQVLCDQIHNNTFKEPPLATGLKKSDSALCMFNILTALIPYASMKSEKIQKGFGDDLVKAFVTGIGNTWDGTHRGCIHALSVCSFELPASVASSYPSIVQMMGKNMSQSHLTIHILEFLAQVARLPDVHSSFVQNEITQIFGICLQFLEKTREMHNSSLSTPSPRSGTPARHSGLNLRRPPYRAAIAQDTALPQYASALAYHTMIFWFLSLRLDIRAKYVSWIIPRLIWKTSKGEEIIEEQGQVLVDMMQRTAFMDLGETAPNPEFAQDSDGAVSSESWIVGLSILTVETAGHTGLTQLTKRQASGTTHTIYRQLTQSIPSHHAPNQTEIKPQDMGRFGTINLLPSHILLQMVSTATPVSTEDQPVYLPHEDYVTRALNVFDRIPTVDSHKIGVLYIGPGQSKEKEYLANTTTSPSFEGFIEGLGYRVSLEPPLRYNPQGLQYPRDGNETVAWRDRTLEIVYHVPSMMPNNLEEDASCNMKKSHVGNCHVVIVFNESGLPWNINQFSSAVTLVQVIITPVNRASVTTEAGETSQQPGEVLSSGSSFVIASGNPSDYYSVLVETKENYPNVSGAADPKVISKEMLPAFVRMFSINANLFSQSKVAADSNDDEYPSTWRARLQAIKRLKDRVLEKTGSSVRSHSIASGNADRLAALSSGRKTPVLREEVHGVEADGALALQLDFGNWTSPVEKD